MKIATGIMIVLFISVALFGFSGVCHAPTQPSHGSHTASATHCILPVIGECVGAGIDMVVHHVSAYQAFSHTTIDSVMLLSLYAVLIGLVLVLVLGVQGVVPAISSGHFYRARVRDRHIDTRYLSTRKFSKYLALFELSPACA